MVSLCSTVCLGRMHVWELEKSLWLFLCHICELSWVCLGLEIKLHPFQPGQQSLLMPSSVQFSSVAQSCPTLCDPIDCSTPGLPVHHQLLEFTQTHVIRVGDAIQLSHPLLSPSPPAPNPSQHQGLFK